MKHSLLVSIVLGLLAFAVQDSHAQTLTPEWKFDLTYRDQILTHAPTLTFGYDTRATAGQDTAFGELSAPAIPGFGGGAYFTYEQDGDIGTYIDILPKPATDSFTLQYLMHILPSSTPGHLTWDSAAIPQDVSAILVSPISAPSRVLLDLKKASSIDLVTTGGFSNPAYYSNWSDVYVTLYYKTTPAAVESNELASGLLEGLGAYPNPMHATGKLSFQSNAEASVSVIGYDAAGRVIAHLEARAHAGANELSLDGLSNGHGPLLLHVEATSGSAREAKTILLVRE